MKLCPSCDERKDQSEFGANKRNADGLATYCKPCRRAKARRPAVALRLGPLITLGLRECSVCELILPIDDFFKNPDCIGRRAHSCKRCHAARSRRSRERRYGLSSGEYERRHAAQGGVCAACGERCRSGRRLAIDHDHGCCGGDYSCGSCVRGLLCARCNLVLGRVGDDVGVLRSLANYLEASR